MSIIDPKNNTRKPSVATVSFTLYSPERNEAGLYKKVATKSERNSASKELM